MEGFIGQLMLVGFSFNPRAWAKCEGQLLPIAQNTALFSLLGTTYGGDGRTTFGLPDLRGRAPMGVGTGPGLSPKSWGQRSGSETQTLTTNQMPSHTHGANAPAASGAGTTDSPVGHAPAEASDDIYGTADAAGAAVTVGNAGGGQAFNIRDPYLAMVWCICTQGIYPSRS